MTQRRPIRQGDILLVPATNSPPGYVPKGPEDAVLAYGEEHGHAHVIEDVTWIVAPTTTDDQLETFAQTGEPPSPDPIFIFAPEATWLTHDTHEEHGIASGLWQVIRQTDHDYETDRKKAVID